MPANTTHQQVHCTQQLATKVLDTHLQRIMPLSCSYVLLLLRYHQQSRILEKRSQARIWLAACIAAGRCKVLHSELIGPSAHAEFLGSTIAMLELMCVAVPCVDSALQHAGRVRQVAQPGSPGGGRRRAGCVRGARDEKSVV